LVLLLFLGSGGFVVAEELLEGFCCSVAARVEASAVDLLVAVFVVVRCRDRACLVFIDI
jgi:hypothetical protein